VDDDTVWAQGTHEYRPMGVAVIAANCVFTPRDFRRSRRGISRFDPRFEGFFASLGEMNDYLAKRRTAKSRSQGFTKRPSESTTPTPPPF
jgi:hypothetical protein